MSLKQPKQFTYEGVTYTVAPFPTTHGMKLLSEMMLKVGEPLIQLIGVFKEGKGLQSEIKPETISAIFTSLYTRVNPDVLDDLLKRLLEGTTSSATGSQNLRQVYDTYFVDSYDVLCKVAFESLKAQYGSFSKGLGGLKNLAATMKAQA